MTAIELIHTRTGDVLRNAQSGLPSGLYRILIPAGAQLWRVGVQTGDLPVPCSAVMSMDAPPDAARAEPVGHDYRQVLPRLWAGNTLRSDSPANAGTLSVSQSEPGTTWRADRDRWLYLKLDFGSYLCLGWQSQIDLHAGVGPAPTPAPAPVPVPVEPDLALAQRTLGYATQSGLVAALMKTAGAKTEEQLIDWVRSQGDLWFSLCRLAGLAEQNDSQKTTTEGAHA